MFTMKHLLITIIAAVLLVGCGESWPDNSIHDAAAIGDIEAVKQHIAAGADVNEKEEVMGNTPLHDAALGGHKEIAKLLISKGADLNAKGDAVGTPLDLAEDVDEDYSSETKAAKQETANLLRKHGGKTWKELN